MIILRVFQGSKAMKNKKMKNKRKITKKMKSKKIKTISKRFQTVTKI